MKSCIYPLFIALLLLCALSLTAATARGGFTMLDDPTTLLDKFVQEPDPSYKYAVWKTEKAQGYTLLLVNMTSQTWLNEQVVSHPVWNHFLLLCVPDDAHLLVKNHALMMIQGNNMNQIPKMNDEYIVPICQTTQSIAAALFNIPEQPLQFPGDVETKRSEDSLMAYSWYQFMKSGDYHWPVLFPMVKASVRGMDTITSVVKSVFGHDIETFTLFGASKRAWTAWLTAAVETKRVKHLIPIVIDLLNMDSVFKHIHNSKCGWPEAMKDYEKMGVLELLGQPEFDSLIQLIDPYQYVNRLAHMPKVIINAGNDEFFWPDGSTFSYLNIPGAAKQIRYVPNAGHALSGSDALLSILISYYALLHNIELPQYTFEKTLLDSGSANLTMTLTKGKRPTKVLLWACTNEKNRDFRNGVVASGCYKSQELKPINPDVQEWRATVHPPTEGYTSFFIEMAFGDYLPIPTPGLKFTSSAYIIPETTPCHFH